MTGGGDPAGRLEDEDKDDTDYVRLGDSSIITSPPATVDVSSETNGQVAVQGGGAVAVAHGRSAAVLLRALPFYYLLHVYVILHLALAGGWPRRTKAQPSPAAS